MINRVLIRIKVIQILYSYLLVEKKFSFESMPSAPTKEKRFAYALYLDMLVLFYRIARSIKRRGGDMPLADTRFIKRIGADEQLKSLNWKYGSAGFPMESAVDRLADQIKNSSYYKNWLKKVEAGEPGAEESVWPELFTLFILADKGLSETISQRENFTLKGLERMRGMMEDTFANFMASQDDGAEADKALCESLDKARELYFRLLLLPVELTYMEERRLEENSRKYLATPEDLNPNMRFVDNAFVAALRDSEIFRNFVDSNKLSWIPEEQVMMDSLLTSILESDIYQEYMEAPSTDMAIDCEFWKNVFRKIIFTNENFLQALEDKSVFWNDDLDIMGTFVIKTIKRVEEGNTHPILDKFKDEEDARFGYDLLRFVLRNKDQYRGYIDDVLVEHKWDRDRLAFMDVVIMITALAEILNFPKIPLKVSINEYLEIAKSYSSAKSSSFVHGLLGDVVDKLKEEHKLYK